jgi:hypothetical protein
MKRKLLLLLALCLALPLQAAEDYPQIKWEALVPKGWDPTRTSRRCDLASCRTTTRAPWKRWRRSRHCGTTRPPSPRWPACEGQAAGLRHPAGKQGRQGLRVPAGALLRRLHPQPAAARQPDHPCGDKEAGETCTAWMRSGQRHPEPAVRQHALGQRRLPADAWKRSKTTTRHRRRRKSAALRFNPPAAAGP